MLIAHKINLSIVQQIGGGQMHILTHRQIQRVSGLVRVHNVLIMLQTNRITHSIIEREIHIVGKISEDTGKKTTEVIGQRLLGLGGQLGLNLGLHIGHQT